MTNLPVVKDQVEVAVLNHTFRFRRLKWADMPMVTTWMSQHKMQEATAIMARALIDVSGREVTPIEALTVLSTMPYTARDVLFKFYKGSLDPHRLFTTPPLYAAPDAQVFARQLEAAEAATDQQVDELEEFLTAKFGHKEVAEEMELGRQIAEGTGYAGAATQEQEFLTKLRTFQELE